MRHTQKPVSARLNPAHPLSLRLTHFWLMNEGSGLTLRNIGRAFHTGSEQPQPASNFDVLLTSNAEQTWERDANAVAMSLSCLNAGTSNGGRFRDASSVIEFGGSWSLQVRIQPRGQTDSWGSLATVGTGIGIYLRGSGAGGSNGKLDVHTNTTDVFSTTVMDNTSTNRTWYDWILTQDQPNTAGILYLNGVVDTTFSSGGWGTFAPNNFFNDSGGETYCGLVDFMRIWRRVLTPSEVRMAYEAPFANLMPVRRAPLYVSAASGNLARTSTFIF